MRFLDLIEEIKPKKLLSNHFLAVIVLLIPTIFFRFQAHHDGYVLESARLFRKSLEGNFDYPFSQYGSAWTVLLGFSTYIFPQKILLIGIRLISLFSYAISISIANKIYFSVKRKSLPLSFTLFTIITWYFFGPYYGWPSTFILPLVLLVSLILTRIVLFEKSSRNLFITSGFLIGLIQLARIQIGICLVISLIFFCLLFLNVKDLAFLLLGNLLGLLLIFSFLGKLGFLKSALFDQFIFAWNFHLSSDRGATRIPRWTLLISVIVFLYLISIRKFLKKNQYLYLPPNIVIVAILLVLNIEMLDSNPIFGIFHWKIVQRAFVGLCMGIVFYVLYLAVKELWMIKKARYDEVNKAQVVNILISLIAFSVCSQIYPLFSSHHAWYSIIPLLLAYSLFHSDDSENLRKGSVQYLKVFATILSFLHICIWVFTNAESSVRAPMNQVVFIDTADKSELRSIYNIAKEIPMGSKVLNLCQNPTIFVVRSDLVPSSRIFIWWKKFEEFEEYRSELQMPSSFAFICSEENYLIPKFFDMKNWVQIGTNEDAVLFKKIVA